MTSKAMRCFFISASPTHFSHWTFSYEDASVRPILRPGSSPAAGNWGRLCASRQTLSTKQDQAETFTKVRQLMLSKPCGRTSRNDKWICSCSFQNRSVNSAKLKQSTAWNAKRRRNSRMSYFLYQSPASPNQFHTARLLRHRRLSCTMGQSHLKKGKKAAQVIPFFFFFWRKLVPLIISF